MERNEFVTIVVTGIPGVGKTTVLRHVERICGERGIKIRVYNFGDFMLEEAQRRGLVRHRDEIRKLPLRLQLELQEHAARAIIERARSELAKGSALLIDTHAVIKTPIGYWPGLPKNVVEVLKPDVIVVIEGRPEEILARQARDKTRFRGDLSRPELVRDMLSYARTLAFASAAITASSVYIVENPEGNPEAAAERIVEILSLFLQGAKS